MKLTSETTRQGDSILSNAILAVAWVGPISKLMGTTLFSNLLSIKPQQPQQQLRLLLNSVSTAASNIQPQQQSKQQLRLPAAAAATAAEARQAASARKMVATERVEAATIFAAKIENRKVEKEAKTERTQRQAEMDAAHALFEETLGYYNDGEAIARRNKKGLPEVARQKLITDIIDHKEQFIRRTLQAGSISRSDLVFRASDLVFRANETSRISRHSL